VQCGIFSTMILLLGSIMIYNTLTGISQRFQKFCVRGFMQTPRQCRSKASSHRVLEHPDFKSSKTLKVLRMLY
jgi:hypothetical protein